MQPKLLRVLEEREFERVGGNTLLKADFRLIAATNQNLEDMLTQRTFRKDLFFRLNVIPLNIPPLRARREDIIPLARHLLEQIADLATGSRYGFSKEAEKAMIAYDWPGNGRELSNVLERVLSTLEGDLIHPWDLPFYLKNGPSASTESGTWSFREVVARAEKNALLHALARSGNNKAMAARMLGVHRTLIYKKMKKYNLLMDEISGDPHV